MREVIVAGGGPAGSATALRLARLGHDVLLLDRAEFPRSKPCAEYLSPGTVQELRRLSVWPPVSAASGLSPADLPSLRGFLLFPDGPEPVTCDFNGRRSNGGVFGTAVPRRTLDAYLLDCARQAGVEVRESFHVRDLWYDPRASGAVGGVQAVYRGREHCLRSRVVIGADGLRSVVGRRLGVLRRRGPKRVALVAHYAGLDGLDSFGEMHITSSGYCGIAPLGGGLANVAMVLSGERARAAGGQVEATFETVLRALPGVRERLAQAELASAVLTSGPFAQSARRAAAPGALLVGDAADFYDPFTGQGLHSALRGAERAAQVVHELLAFESEPAARRQGQILAQYDTWRRQAFLGKWVMERMLQQIIARPGLLSRAAHNLRRHSELATQLVQVMGDMAPAWQVLRPDYLARILVA